MARPTKDPSELCKRWDTLYVSDAERAAVTASAAKASLSVSRYFMALQARRTIVNRSDWRRNVQLLSVVTQQLDEIARAVGAIQSCEGAPAFDASDSLNISALLLGLERLIRDTTMPWQSGPPLDPFDDAGGDPC